MKRNSFCPIFVHFRMLERNVKVSYLIHSGIISIALLSPFFSAAVLVRSSKILGVLEGVDEDEDEGVDVGADVAVAVAVLSISSALCSDLRIF